MDTSHGSSVQLSNCPPPQRLGVFRPAQPCRCPRRHAHYDEGHGRQTPAFRPRFPHAMAANPAQKRTRGEIEGEAGAFGRFFEMAAFLGRRRRPKFRAIVT